jgi:RNA polymerase sporulation-specific sigma factor
VYEGGSNLFEFEKHSIDEIIEEAKERNNQFAYNYLIKKYEGMIHGIIRKQNFYLQGGEYEDLIQEGYTGLYKAIRDFKSEHGSFEMFCKIVIKRHIITAIKKSTRLKHKPMNEMYSFDKVLPDNENLTMMDIIGFREDVLNRSDLDTLDPFLVYVHRVSF